MIHAPVDYGFIKGIPQTAITYAYESLYSFTDFTSSERWNSIILRIEDAIKDIFSLYEVRLPHEVKEYLLSNQFLVDIIIEANEKITNIFGTNVAKILELEIDPEEGFEELFIVIRSSLPPAEGRKRLNFLMDNWFLEVLERTEGKLNITEEPDEF